MNAQALISYSPFLAVLYAAFALLQALRHKQQGLIAMLLALLSVGVPLAAYVLSSDATVRDDLIQFMTLNAVVVFVASLLTLLTERGRMRKDPNHSYGMLGLAVSIVLAIGMFALPMLTATEASASFPDAAGFTPPTGSTAADASGELPDIFLVSQEAGSTVEAPTFPLQADTSGEETPSSPPQGNSTDGEAPAFPPQTDPSGEDAPVQEASPEPVIEATTTPMPEVIATTVIRPTRIAFDTATPTPEIPQAVTADATTVESAAATCTLIVNYNLNLRDIPGTEGSTVYLSIPYGTTVETTGQTKDGWYAVAYAGQSGWVSGDYVTPGLSCDTLPVVEAN